MRRKGKKWGLERGHSPSPENLLKFYAYSFLCKILTCFEMHSIKSGAAAHQPESDTGKKTSKRNQPYFQPKVSRKFVSQNSAGKKFS